MSGFKKFLDRRAEGIAREKAAKEKAPDNEADIAEIEENLSDDEFWAISNQFIKESKHTDNDHIEILQTILTAYTPIKIKQFAKRFKELNASK